MARSVLVCKKSVHDAVVADLDGGGEPELAKAGAAGPVKVHVNLGGGIFGNACVVAEIGPPELQAVIRAGLPSLDGADEARAPTPPQGRRGSHGNARRSA